MTGDFVVTLIGGSPWGFRIRGGSETSHPIHVSRINGGGKAGKYGIREGDIIEAVNGRCLTGLSQIEVQQLIRNSGDNLTLKLRRDNELLSRLFQTSDSRLAVMSSEDREKPSETMSVEMYLKNNKDNNNDDVTGEQTSEGVRPISITISTSTIAPVGPMFKAQATKAIWMPDRSASTKQSEHLSKSFPSPVKSENNLQLAQNGNDICSIATSSEISEDLISNRCNGLSGTFDVDDMEGKTVIGKLMPCNVDASNVTYSVELSDKPLPKEAVVVDQKVTVEDGNIHQDTYYAIPYDKVTTTKTVIKAPTYEGIGPTEDGLPVGLRTAVKKEYGSDWYKTMFRSLHKCDSQEGLKVQADGYMSDPELNRKDKASNIKSRNKMLVTNKPVEKSSKTNKSSYTFPAAKSSIETYNHKPWIISDYEPGYSSIANNENLYTNARYLPPLITPKPKYTYNDGYDSDSTLVRKTGKVHTLDPQQQKQWYQNIQKGGEIPLPGLCKPAPLKPEDPVVGPAPPMPTDWDADHYYNVYASNKDNYRRYTSPLHSPVQSAKTSENSKQKLQDDFLSKLDDVLSNQRDDNMRQSSIKPSNGNCLSLSPNAAPASPDKVIVLYDFVAQTSRELSLRKGDIVSILRRIDKNWYEGKTNGKTGIFPVSYAEPVSSKSSQRLSKKYIKGWARAKFDFIAKNQIELTLNKDDLVSLIREVDSNWYEGSLNGKSGIFPISYVEMISDSECPAKTSKSTLPSLVINPIRNGRNELELNNNNPEKTINIEKVVSPTNESLPTRNNFTKFNFSESEYKDNRISPYQALYAYKPQNDDELELKEGDVVYVVEKCDDGWFVGTSMRTGLFGTFPGNYIEKI